ncbi:hypothetical protein FHG87_017501, partial [Trinorchestia longiramus]
MKSMGKNLLGACKMAEVHKIVHVRIPAYFEFLLKPSMLEEHLQQPNPDPSPIELMAQMVCNSLKRPASEQSVGSHADVELMQRKGHMLIVLPLRILAHLNFDLQLLLDKVPLDICDALLNCLMAECLGPMAADLTPTSCCVDLATLLSHQVWSCTHHMYTPHVHTTCTHHM